MNCTTCNFMNSKYFDAEAALRCWKCFPEEKPKLKTIDEFERFLVSQHQSLAEQLLEADRVYLKSLPKQISKKQQARDRVERLKAMTAAAGRETFEKKKKPVKPPANPVVTLRLFDNDAAVVEHRFDAGKAFSQQNFHSSLKKCS